MFPPVDDVRSEGVLVVIRFTICSSFGSTDDAAEKLVLQNGCFESDDDSPDSDTKDGLDGTRCGGLSVVGGTGEVDPDL